MTAETYRDLFGADCEYSTAYILTDGDAYALGAALSSNSRVASVTVSEALQDIVDNTMKSLDYIVGLVVVCACALALVVLFNLCNISITERVREIATVKVLGFYHRETLNYVFREILLLTFCGALVGLPAGWALHPVHHAEYPHQPRLVPHPRHAAELCAGLRRHAAAGRGRVPVSHPQDRPHLHGRIPQIHRVRKTALPETIRQRGTDCQKPA